MSSGILFLKMLESKGAVTLPCRSLTSTMALANLSPIPGMIRSSLGVAKFTAILCSGSILRQEVATQNNQFFFFFFFFFQAFFRDDAVVGFGLVYQV